MKTHDSVYRSQLASSLKAFQHKQWQPLPAETIENTFLRCRPVSCQSDTRPHPPRCSSATTRSYARPRSVPPSSRSRPSSCVSRRCASPDTENGKSDVLSSDVLASFVSERSLPSNRSTVSKETVKQFESALSSGESTTSGIESSESDDEGDSSSSCDSDSEPPLDPMRMSHLPDMNLVPEKTDSIYVPESKKKLFDFDPNNVEQPPYEFAPALPTPFCDLDFRKIMENNWNWRHEMGTTPVDESIAPIIERMLEMEKIQRDTEIWEQKRFKQVQVKRPITSTSVRANSAKPRDKRCCPGCLQIACVGDCPLKQAYTNSCESCRQSLCLGKCKEVSYDQRMRQQPTDEQKVMPRSATPRYCSTCQGKNNAKFINVNNTILARPKSGHATFSRGQQSKRPKELRSESQTLVAVDISNELEKLGLETSGRSQSNNARATHIKGRNSVLPGKSVLSQKRESLTDVEDTIRRRRLKSRLGMKRPKTALGLSS